MQTTIAYSAQFRSGWRLFETLCVPKPKAPTKPSALKDKERRTCRVVTLQLYYHYAYVSLFLLSIFCLWFILLSYCHSISHNFPCTIHLFWRTLQKPCTIHLFWRKLFKNYGRTEDVVMDTLRATPWQVGRLHLNTSSHRHLHSYPTSNYQRYTHVNVNTTTPVHGHHPRYLLRHHKCVTCDSSTNVTLLPPVQFHDMYQFIHNRSVEHDNLKHPSNFSFWHWDFFSNLISLY